MPVPKLSSVKVFDMMSTIFSENKTFHNFTLNPFQFKVQISNFKFEDISTILSNKAKIGDFDLFLRSELEKLVPFTHSKTQVFHDMSSSVELL